jgi:O-antigen ligase
MVLKLNKDMNNFLSKKIFTEYLFTTIFLISFIVSNISNNTLEALLIKFVFSFTLIVLFLSLNFNNKYLLQQFHSSLYFKKIFLFLFLIIIYLSMTLLYSVNPYYGLMKILNIVISFFPLVYVSIFILENSFEMFGEKFLRIIILLSLLSVIYILITYPFQFGTIYLFTPSRWSHVIYGRFISLSALICFLYSIVSVNSKKKNYLFLLSILFLFFTFYSGYRMGFIALLVTFLTAGFVQLKKNRIYLLSVVVIIVTLFLIILFTKFQLIERYNELIYFYRSSPSISSRLEAWDLAFRFIFNNIFFGAGFGGFNSIFNGITIGSSIHYPHNIILESLAELGLLGGIGLIILIFKIFRSSFTRNRYVGYFFIYSFLLSLTAKDLTTNNFFFIGIIFLFNKKSK